MPRFTSRSAELALSSYALRYDDGHPACPDCGYGCTSRRDDGLCEDCGHEADVAEARAEDTELAADLASDEGFLATCGAEVAAWIASLDQLGPDAGAGYARAS